MKDQWDNFWKRRSVFKITEVSWSKRRIIMALDRYVTMPHLRVLDAGCGSGFFAKYFVEKGCDVWACDYSAEAIRITQKTTGNQCRAYLKIDLLDTEFCEKNRDFFDIVFTDGLFEHFSAVQQKQLIANFVFIKKREGKIITFVPNKYSWWTFVRPLLMHEIPERPFTIRGLKTLHSDLEIIEYGGVNIIPVKYSPDIFFGDKFGMLIFVVAK